MASGRPRVPRDAALLVVDLQEDFCPGGALPVPQGGDVVPLVNQWVEAFRDARRPVAYSQDWHPPGHTSFKERGGPWPPHCVQGTKGAEFRPGLRVEGAVFRKGFEVEREAYSAFEGRLSDPRGGGEANLAAWLRQRKVKHLFVVGLALDYCVKQSALDALGQGFQVTVLREATRAVEVDPGDGDRALREIMTASGRVL